MKNLTKLAVAIGSAALVGVTAGAILIGEQVGGAAYDQRMTERCEDKAIETSLRYGSTKQLGGTRVGFVSWCDGDDSSNSEGSLSGGSVHQDNYLGIETPGNRLVLYVDEGADGRLDEVLTNCPGTATTNQPDTLWLYNEDCTNGQVWPADRRAFSEYMSELEQKTQP
jgi:hypothetical protein